MGKDYSIVFNSIQDTKPRVKSLLEAFPPARESDDRLLALFWYYEILQIDVEKKVQSRQDFFVLLSSGKLTPAESIRRSRQILVAKHPELRGENYVDRKKAGYETREKFKEEGYEKK